MKINPTLRERVKVQRGWKTPKSAISEGKRINYNFVKPYMALEEQTPAAKAGIKKEGRIKWITLMRNSMK